MLECLPSSLRISVSGSRITLLEQRGWRHPTTRLLADHTPSEREPFSSATVIAHVRALLSSVPIISRRSTTIVLGDDLVRYFIVTPPVNVARFADCQAAAALRFQVLFGESSVEWTLAADWDVQRPFVGCAIPNALHNGLMQVAAEHKLRIMRVEPCFVEAWNQWRNKLATHAWLAVAFNQMLTIGVINEERLVAVRSTPLAPDAWHDERWLSNHLTREALLLGLPPPQRLQVYGEVPDGWTDRNVGPFAYERLGVRYDGPSAPDLAAGRAAAQTEVGA